ncbi:MAG: transposase [Gammaproteobacteria bacterium]|nr:transposase [Gammaproteobacteria bacterium]
MARKPRFTLAGVPQHVIQRGHNREPCFYAEHDYAQYLANLSEAAKHNQVAIHAYVLMKNHVHLLVTPAHSHGITHIMQDTGRKYVRYINSRYKRSGTLWEGRYKASLVNSEAYLLTCMQYIEMNLVRAVMVCHPSEYRWSSYHSNAGQNKDFLLEAHPVYRRLGIDDQERHYAYRELFSSNLSKEDLHDIREALNQELVLGREDFKDKIELMTKRQARPGKPGRPGVKESGAIYYVF